MSVVSVLQQQIGTKQLFCAMASPHAQTLELGTTMLYCDVSITSSPKDQTPKKASTPKESSLLGRESRGDVAVSKGDDKSVNAEANTHLESLDDLLR